MANRASLDILALFAWPESAKMLVGELPTPGDGDSSRAALPTLAGRFLRGVQAISETGSVIRNWNGSTLFPTFFTGVHYIVQCKGVKRYGERNKISRPWNAWSSIKEARNALGLSRRALAEQISIDPRYLANIENSSDLPIVPGLYDLASK